MQPSFYRTLGQKIKACRKAKGITLTELADTIHRSPASLSKYESGNVNIALDALVEICTALNVSEVPNSGELIYAVEDDKVARDIADTNRASIREERIHAHTKVSLENLFDRIKEGEMKELNIVVKGDVKGSVEAVNQSLLKITDRKSVV